jgi:FkbM family methyltransferase
MSHTIDWQGELNQDQFVINTLQQKTHGYFVEFGAMNGREYSNTWVLEKHYHWNGILSEPNPRFHQELASNRSCIIDNRAVWSETGSQLNFVCRDHGFSELAQPEKTYSEPMILVSSVSLNDLLDAHHAPDVIDYISMDTEGSELDILKSFDWSRRTVMIWTIEHAWQEDKRKHIQNIMKNHGYNWVCQNQTQYDDYFVHESLGVIE